MNNLFKKKKKKTVKAKFQSECADGPVEAFKASAKKMKGNHVKGDKTHRLRRLWGMNGSNAALFVSQVSYGCVIGRLSILRFLFSGICCM